VCTALAGICYLLPIIMAGIAGRIKSCIATQTISSPSVPETVLICEVNPRIIAKTVA